MPTAASPVSNRRLYRLDLPGGSHVYRNLTANPFTADEVSKLKALAAAAGDGGESGE